MRASRPGLVCLGVDAQHQAALAARRDRHVAADQERQPAEHPLLGDVRLGGDQLADAVGEVLVVRHAGMIADGLVVSRLRSGPRPALSFGDERIAPPAAPAFAPRAEDW